MSAADENFLQKSDRVELPPLCIRKSGDMGIEGLLDPSNLLSWLSCTFLDGMLYSGESRDM